MMVKTKIQAGTRNENDGKNENETISKEARLTHQDIMRMITETK